MIKIEFEEPISNTTECKIDLTENAKKKLKSVFADQPESFLRLSVVSGGCNGFNYTFDIDSLKKEGDLEVTIDGITIVVDAHSNDYVTGSTIDFLEELHASHFKVINPNATSSCSCGTSFSI